jgi:outer membrane protein OmpA-like peptidoglycan-associated protein
MGSKRFIPVILFLGVLVAGSYYYLCQIKQVCGDFSLNLTDNPKNPGAEEEPFRPLSFQFNSADPIIGDQFNDIRDELLSKVGETDTLVVNGMYFGNEQNGNDLAQERADNVKSLLEDHIDITRLQTHVNFDGMTSADDKTSLEAVKFTIVSSGLSDDLTDDDEELADESDYETTDEWVNESGDIDDAVESGVADNVTEENTNQEATGSFVGDIDNRATIYFPKGSIKKNITPELRSYVDGLVALMKRDPNVKVYVVGHSDDEGDQGEDHQLGRRRAWVVKKMIWDRGVNPMRIITSSKGEAEPRNGSDSDVGHAYNRRVEIIINR